MIEIEPPVERAFLVGAPRKGSADAAHVEEHLDELGRLADTAGARVVGRMLQRIEKPTGNFFIGEGKVEELKEQLTATGATLVFFDDPLSPAQGVGLEKALGVRVMDRSEVILDIFATRAKSHEARLQVELAQLEYLFPRLARMWSHLSRIRGGIGLRGPGETQLETDRRAIRRKISTLRHRLDEVAAHRANQRQGRREVPSAGLVGYTNAGKSSLLKALSGTDVFVEDRLFATLDTLTREVDVGEGYQVRVTDTVGFIRKLPHHLVASFRATLEEAREADLLLHVIDASHPMWEEQVEVVEGVLEEMGLGKAGNVGDASGSGRRETGNVRSDQQVIHVFNKSDLLPDPDAFLQQVQQRYPDAIVTSTFPVSRFPSPDPFPLPDGVASLRSELRSAAQSLRPVVQIRVPVANGKLLAGLYRDAEVLGQVQEEEWIVVTARVEAKVLGKLRQQGVEVEVGGRG